MVDLLRVWLRLIAQCAVVVCVTVREFVLKLAHGVVRRFRHGGEFI